MRQGWQFKKLGDVCEIVNGGTPDTKVARFWEGENLWITPKDMGQLTDVYVWDTIRKLTDDGLKNSSAKLLPVDSVILSSRAPIGHLAINKTELATNQGCKGIIPGQGLSTLFLFYFLKHSVDLLNSLGSGTTFKELSGSKLAAVMLPLPPLPEQHRIVAILDEAFAAIAKAKENAEKNLANARAVFDLSFDNLFINDGFQFIDEKLGDICSFRNGINYTQHSRGEVIKIVGVGDFKDRFWVPLDTLNTIVIDGHLKPHDVLQKDDILTVRSNGNQDLIGRSMLTGIINEPVSHSGFTIRIRLTTSHMIPEFLCHFMRSGKARKQLVESGTGTNIKSLNQVALSDLSVPVPSLTQQQAIIDRINLLTSETKKLEDVYLLKLTDLDELKKSILEKAFAGELTTN